ncbi:hypothetical protein DP939_25170 [Spongiactinospora rosea]|uniref:LysM domain-containing protein n=1 Tax=Spongiactinospora rosea TaxID=2248750 RepID=A0A366LTJ6_9ACTN|nr:LysM peptidoglycan-binding domain-containing protein [Spongiactinospora rosea]RBQ17241.1 hypothetical protein DP939_25170 [Spongiactinospora rosea]
MSTHRRQLTSRSWAWRAAVFAGSLAALAAVLGGLPVALWIMAGPPVPADWPTVEDVRRVLWARDDGTLLLGVLKYAGWAAWVSLLYQTAAEAVDGIRHRDPRAGGRNPVRRALRPLLLGLTLIAVTATSTRNAPPPGRPVAAVTAAAPLGHAERLPQTAATVQEEERTYRVRPGDTLWDIAKDELGSPYHWPQIWQVNAHHEQADGVRFRDPDLIHSGWILRLPAVPDAEPEQGPDETQHEHDGKRPPVTPTPLIPALTPSPSTTPSVRSPFWPSPAPVPGQPTPPEESISSAPEAGEDHTGSDEEQRKGPGVADWAAGAVVGVSFAAAAVWVIARSRARARPSAPPRGAGRRAAPGERRVWPPEPPETAAPVPAARPATRGRQRPPQGPRQGLPTPSGPDPAPRPDGPTERGFRARTAPPSPQADRQQMRARAPRPVLIPPAQIIMAATPQGELRVDLADGMGLVGPAAGDIARAVLLGLLLDDPHEQTTIITTTGLAEHLLGDASLPVRPDELPGLTFTATVEDALATLEVEAAWRLRLLTDHDAADIVTLRRKHPHLPVPSLVVILGALDGAARARLEALLTRGRRYDIAALILDAWPAAATLTVDPDAVVADVTYINDIGAGRRSPLREAQMFHLPHHHAGPLLAALRAAASPADSRPEKPHARPAEPRPDLNDGSNGPEMHHPAKQPAQPATPPADHPVVPSASPRATSSLTGQSSQAPHHKGQEQMPAHPRDERSAEARKDPGSPASRADRPLELRLFGTARVLAHGQEVLTGLRTDTRRLLALLALHPAGLSVTAIFDALWPSADPTGDDIQLLYTAANKGRTALRKVTRTREVFIIHHGDHYRLDPATISCDWWAFTDIATTAAHAKSEPERIRLLEKAASLYTGDLAADSIEEWAETTREATRRQAADIFSDLARHYSESHGVTGQGKDTEKTASTPPSHTTAPYQRALEWFDRALKVDPYNESLFNEVMKLQAMLGRPEAVHRTFERLTAAMAELDCSASPSSRALLHRLLDERPSDKP